MTHDTTGLRYIFPYSDEEDSEYYADDDLVLDSSTIRLTACTRAGNAAKLNEDAFAVVTDGSAIWVGVFDGTTSLRPIAALGTRTGARFASHFLKDQFESVTRIQSLRTAMIGLNAKLLDANLGISGTLTDTHSLPSSTGTIMRLDQGPGQIHFAHVGDSYLVVERDDGSYQRLTDDRNNSFDQGMFTLINQIAAQEGVTPREARQTDRVKTALIDMFVRRNNNRNGQGSGLLNGVPHASIYVQEGRCALEGVRVMLLGTDGLTPQGWERDGEPDWERVFEEIKRHGFQGLIAQKLASEDADRDWRHTRYKHSDDATGVLIQLTP